jgi:uncharacterized protein YoxC
MASLGKKILSAFVEVTDDKSPVSKPEETNNASTVSRAPNTSPAVDNSKFRQYFEKLFQEANIPGPDYYEFSRMIEAMNGITHEQSRYAAAFAGLQVQGLSRVYGKQKEMDEKTARIEQLSREINDLQHQVTLLKDEVKENEQKIGQSTGSYKTAMENMKSRILLDMEKIKQFIQ